MHKILKKFIIALKMIDVIDNKQMYHNVITGKENASKEWNCTTSMFLMSFNVCFVFGYAYFVCICLKTAIWLFLIKTGWQPWSCSLRCGAAGQLVPGLPG